MFVGVLLSSCAYYAVKPNYVVTKTGTAGEPKPVGCDFAIVTTKVDRPYEEVALLDRTVAAENASSFKQAIAEDVCKLGGDAVFAEVNGAGSYVRGTVLRWKDSGAGNER
jgi:phage terminase large subunit-like protein